MSLMAVWKLLIHGFKGHKEKHFDYSVSICGSGETRRGQTPKVRHAQTSIYES